MVRLHFLNEKGWELPDYFDCGPKDFETEKQALDIVMDALSHTINMSRLNNVVSIRVVGSDGKIVDIPRENWCFW